jgi:hypothetical protein
MIRFVLYAAAARSRRRPLAASYTDHDVTVA